jgi:8-oxo-dGTP pyrophosphatase MutT (NUDIX family)
MVVRRPNGKLITAIKSFYPPGAFRLLTGGIHRRERILDALLRETHEETGLEVEVRRFLAVVNYRLMHRRNANAFTTYAFLIDEVGGRLESLDPDEELGEYREIAVDDLPAMAAFLDNLAATPDEKIHGKWHDWGRFRAVIHRAVYETLKSDEW